MEILNIDRNIEFAPTEERITIVEVGIDDMLVRVSFGVEEFEELEKKEDSMLEIAYKVKEIASNNAHEQIMKVLQEQVDRGKELSEQIEETRKAIVGEKGAELSK